MVTYWDGVMDLILKALADPTRQQLLDRLRERDGQTLTELEGSLGMTRFGVMKHLKILEAATLIVTHKQGRFKHHYLNATPLQELVDRWIEPLIQQPMARALRNLKATLEGENDMDSSVSTKPDFMMETYIRTTPERLWEALTSQELSARYNVLAGAIHGDFTAGGKYRHVLPNGDSILSGTILRADPPAFLELTFLPGWMGPDAAPSRVSYEIDPQGPVCLLTIRHYGIPQEQEGVKQGWARILSSLKTLLETGDALEFRNAA